MENITLDVGNNSQNILPVPYPKQPTPTVPSATNYGSSPYPLSVKDIPNRKNDELQYCNFLEPSPRNQALNVPYLGNKNCPTFKTQPYQKDSCYLMESGPQGVVGIVCNQPGGSDNANFYRGNQFGVDYPFNQDLEKKKLEYTVEQPVQIPLELENPSIIYNKKMFYPEYNYFLKDNKNYLTYPQNKNYTESGLPTYNYPYKTLNPIFNEKSFQNNIESFTNKKEKKILILVLVIIAIFIIVYITRL